MAIARQNFGVRENVGKKGGDKENRQPGGEKVA